MAFDLVVRYYQIYVSAYPVKICPKCVNMAKMHLFNIAYQYAVWWQIHNRSIME